MCQQVPPKTLFSLETFKPNIMFSSAALVKSNLKNIYLTIGIQYKNYNDHENTSNLIKYAELLQVLYLK